MQETIFRGAHDRVLMLPLEVTGVAETGTCPHRHGETGTTELVPKIVVRKNSLGTIENDTGKRQALWDEFERQLGLDDELNPKAEPATGIRVLKSKGIITKELEG